LVNAPVQFDHEKLQTYSPIKRNTYPQDNLQAMSKIGGVYIRDAYLEKHSEIQ